MRDPGAVLITGCSTGIGRASAVRLAKAGYTVVATARRLETLADLQKHGCTTMALDVTDDASMVAAVSAVEAEHGAVGSLVNNAGYAYEVAVEAVDMADLRRQFETNVFGLWRLTQLVLPAMRERRTGCIVNVSSVAGRLTFPGGGPYHASKHAVEAMSDALRFEVNGFSIGVSVIEPGLIKTAFDANITGAPLDGEGPYGEFHLAVAQRISGAYSGPMGRLGASGPDAVAKVVERAVTADRPRSRYRVTAGAKALLGMRALVPDRVWDAMMATSFPRPG